MDQSAEKHSPRPLTPPQTSCSSKHIAITVVVAFTTAVLTSYGTSMLISSQNTHIANPQLTTKLEIIPSATPALTPADALSNWKTVSSKEVGIVFKYPGDKLPYIGMSEVPNASYFGFSAFNHPEKHNPLALTEENVALELIVRKPPVQSGIDDLLSAINAYDNTIISWFNRLMD